jgi:Flp pilus assembly pilin Flp
MQKMWHLLVGLRIWSDRHGQDLIEYAMIAGFIAVVSGMFMPDVSNDVSVLYSRIASTMRSSAATS